METSAERDGGGWVLNGEKHLISNAGIAGVHIVFARTTPRAQTGDRSGLALFLGQKVASGLFGFSFLPAATSVGAAPATPVP